MTTKADVKAELEMPKIQAEHQLTDILYEQ